jgi:hypothetical protein
MLDCCARGKKLPHSALLSDRSSFSCVAYLLWVSPLLNPHICQVISHEYCNWWQQSTSKHVLRDRFKTASQFSIYRSNLQQHRTVTLLSIFIQNLHDCRNRACLHIKYKPHLVIHFVWRFVGNAYPNIAFLPFVVEGEYAWRQKGHVDSCSSTTTARAWRKEGISELRRGSSD